MRQQSICAPLDFCRTRCRRSCRTRSCHSTPVRRNFRSHGTHRLPDRAPRRGRASSACSSGIDAAPFTWEVREIGLQVAGADDGRHDPAPRRARRSRADRIIVPGRCRGDLEALTRALRHPGRARPRRAEGPAALLRPRRAADRPRRIRDRRSLPRSSTRRGSRVTQIVERARRLAADGADVIDLGCLPETPFDHLADSVRALKAAGFTVSVDSMITDELLRGGARRRRLPAEPDARHAVDRRRGRGHAGADPARAGRRGLAARGGSSAMQQRGRPFLADSILDPIPFGLTASIVRYHRLRERFPTRRS